MAWVYVGVKGKFSHLVEDPPPKESKRFNQWPQDDFAVMKCLWNGVESLVNVDTQVYENM